MTLAMMLHALTATPEIALKVILHCKQVLFCTITIFPLFIMFSLSYVTLCLQTNKKFYYTTVFLCKPNTKYKNCVFHKCISLYYTVGVLLPPNSVSSTAPLLKPVITGTSRWDSLIQFATYLRSFSIAEVTTPESPSTLSTSSCAVAWISGCCAKDNQTSKVIIYRFRPA